MTPAMKIIRIHEINKQLDELWIEREDRIKHRKTLIKERDLYGSILDVMAIANQHNNNHVLKLGIFIYNPTNDARFKNIENENHVKAQFNHFTKHITLEDNLIGKLDSKRGYLIKEKRELRGEGFGNKQKVIFR